jgi:hypothetical protein
MNATSTARLARSAARDKVSNRTRLLPKTAVDMRSVSGRRFRFLVQTFTQELGGGPLSEHDHALVRQAAAITMRCDEIQAAIVAGHADVNADQVIRLSSECRRIMAALKSKATKNKPAAPSLAEYLAQRAARAAGAPESSET